METTIKFGSLRLKPFIIQTPFLRVYEKLLKKSSDISESEKGYLLRAAIIFLNSSDGRLVSFGYKIVLGYSILTGDHEPLYHVAIEKGFVPISKLLERISERRAKNFDSFSQCFIEAYQDGFKFENDNDETFRSTGQLYLRELTDSKQDVAIVAPTSYGKSELIIRKIELNPKKRICVVVPTKALLAQTKGRLLRSETIRNSYRRVITHPEMLEIPSANFLSVLTQERLLKLFQKHSEVALDFLLVDEAHNLFEKSVRSQALANILIISRKRNDSLVTSFFTPFLADVKNLKTRVYSGEIAGIPLAEEMKIESFFTYDSSHGDLKIFDQYLGRLVDLEVVPLKERDDVSFVESKKGKKNIAYINKPSGVQRFALELASRRPQGKLPDALIKVLAAVSKRIHRDYDLIKCMERGVVFHHGGVPEVVRAYVEDAYTKHGQLDFVVTSSTLLEGVNIPGERMFILNPKKGRNYLSASQFRNLYGRICRFKDVFSPVDASIDLLQPKIYLIKGKYSPKRFDIEKFYRKRVDRKIGLKDEVENPLLVNSSDSSLAREQLEYLENIEEGTTSIKSVTRPTFEISKLCFSNSVSELDILASEKQLQMNLENFIRTRGSLISSSNRIVDAIVAIFFEGNKIIGQHAENLNRLREHEEARKFYSMFLDWRSKGSPYPAMISQFLGYWKDRVNKEDAIVYVGRTWGEITSENGKIPSFVNLKSKSESERVNLAIAKIKEEQDYVENVLLKFVEILNECLEVDEELYERIKYGTSDRESICLIKNGLSLELTKLLLLSYGEFLKIDLKNDLVEFRNGLVSQMEKRGENEILVFEMQGNI